MPQPWDIPPMPPTGDTHEDPLNIAVGRALTRWEYVEEAYFDIFSVFIGGHRSADPEIVPALRAYGSVISGRSRSDMLEAAGEAHFHVNRDAPLEKEFKELMKQYRGFGDRRNDIAHGMIKYQEGGWYLAPGLHSTKKYPIGQPPRYCYSSVEIKALADRFDHLYDSAVDFSTRL